MNVTKCKDLIKRDKEVIAPCQHLSYFPMAIAKYNGAVLVDEDGNEFIDFLSSASSANLGGCHPAVTKAIQEQLSNYSQYVGAYIFNRPMVEYAERLTSVYPGGIKAKVAFGNCGSDANDAAIKFARAYTGRSKIITFINGYHGNTYGSMTMSTVTTRMRSKMGPFLPDIYSFPFYGVDVDDERCEKECLKDMMTAFNTYLPVDEVAAVIIEPIQGDGGMLPAHPIFMKKLYELCKENGILFISEEVQQAFYRTGEWFGISHYSGIIPDGIVLGKSLGGGLTLGAFMAREEIMNSLPAPAHVFTLSGNAAACAAGIASFDEMKSPAFKKHLDENILVLQKFFDEMQKEFPDIVGFTRGIGLSCGIGIMKKDENGQMVPDADGTFKILFRCYEKGLLVISVADNVLRIQPPLIITVEQLQKGFAILKEAMADYQAGLISDEVLQYCQGW